MRIIALDPGFERSAWCVFDRAPQSFGIHPNGDMLTTLRHARHPDSELLAVEMIASYGMAVGREIFDTCLWIGRFVEAWERRGGRTQLVYRREVKSALCGSQQAKDANIRAALIDRFGPTKEKAVGLKASPGPLYGISSDIWSALVVAVTVDDAKRWKEAA